MTYPLRPDTMYMMPTHFGPMSGPRQGPGGEKYAFAKDERKSTSISVSFLTNAHQLRPLLPPGFELAGEPVVSVFAVYMKEIDWLAGRGYNVLGVRIPVAFNGRKDRAAGPFLMVLWENLTDPILTGREQLGFSKIYCELPEPVVYNGKTHCTASWLGFRFLDMTITDLEEVAPEDVVPPIPLRPDDTLRGTLHYKYIPKTGAWGEADVAYAVLTPDEVPVTPPSAHWRGRGTVEFHEARWQDLPTQYMVVNTLSALEIKEYRGASIEHRVGGSDISNQRILE